MNVKQLLAYFDRLGEAPHAVPRLRRFILDLAVRGKLVGQDLKDEPAPELMKRIQLEKARRVKKGVTRRTSDTSEISADFVRYVIPANWVWTNLAEIADFSAGRTPSRHETVFWNTGDYPWVSIRDMKAGETLFSTSETVSETAKLKVFGSEPVPAGTLIMSFKLTIGRISRLGMPAFHNEAIISIRPHLLSLDAYLFKVLPLFAQSGNSKDAMKGATLNRESLSSIPIALPPLAEQHRLVAKVDELMALCDQLEAAQQERERRRDRMIAASLQRLNQPAVESTPETQREHARFHLHHLPRLTTQPDHIKAMRQTILNLAVRGKLVEQDSNDEPATQLLKRIQAEKARLAKLGCIRVEKEAEPIEQIGGIVPGGWVLCRWNSIAMKIGDIDHKMPHTVTGGVPYVSPRDFYPNNVIDFEGAKRISREDYLRLAAKIKPDLNDLIYPRYGTIGENRLVTEQRDFLASYSCAVVKTLTGFVDPNYQYIFSISGYCKDQAKAAENKTTQANVGISSIQQYIVPLPPLAEQHRIVAKVNELMALCDQLEAELSITQANSHRLLESVLEDALSG